MRDFLSTCGSQRAAHANSDARARESIHTPVDFWTHRVGRTRHPLALQTGPPKNLQRVGRPTVRKQKEKGGVSPLSAHGVGRHGGGPRLPAASSPNLDKRAAMRSVEIVEQNRQNHRAIASLNLLSSVVFRSPALFALSGVSALLSLSICRSTYKQAVVWAGPPPCELLSLKPFTCHLQAFITIQSHEPPLVSGEGASSFSYNPSKPPSLNPSRASLERFTRRSRCRRRRAGAWRR